jgi:hypothetical protein
MRHSQEEENSKKNKLNKTNSIKKEELNIKKQLQ